jgi:hypothetical protein
MQVSEANPMVGIEGRAALLFNLSKALQSSPHFFGAEARPGNIIGIDYPNLAKCHAQSKLRLP